MAARGRPSLYTARIADDICERISLGESLRSICRDERYPSQAAVLRWAEEDYHGFSERYARARARQAETFADELIDIADDGSNDWMQRANKKGEIEIVLDREHVARSELRLRARQWVMSRILPKKYGDKGAAEGADDVSVVIKGGLPTSDAG